MIMIWNQKEAFVGSSLQKFNEARGILSGNGINYKYRVVDNTSPSFGEHLDDQEQVLLMKIWIIQKHIISMSIRMIMIVTICY